MTSMLSDRFGSSPLTRGKLVHFLSRNLLVGLIPAHAGKTSARPSSRRPRAAHPRSRGENRGHAPASSRRGGSSPLTRGKPRESDLTLILLGLIPAHAGKTTQSASYKTPTGAHPRSRGENTVIPVVRSPVTGSSPLTRGKRGAAADGQFECRLIPAHAGKTAQHRLTRNQHQAHPRSRGENVQGRSADWVQRGSSPLTRGKQGPRGQRGDPYRLIPAHAGKTKWSKKLDQVFRAHPRSRGENWFISSVVTF